MINARELVSCLADLSFVGRVGASNAWVIVTSNSHNCSNWCKSMFSTMCACTLITPWVRLYSCLSINVQYTSATQQITFVHFFQAWWSPPTPRRWSGRYCKSGQQAAGWCE
jgi:hypothetical protein